MCFDYFSIIFIESTTDKPTTKFEDTTMTTTSSPPKILSTIPSTATSESVNTTPTLSPVSPQGKCWLIDQGSRYKVQTQFCAEIYLGLKYTDIFTLQNLQHHSI